MKNSEILLNWASWQEVGQREEKVAILTMPDTSQRDRRHILKALEDVALPYKLLITDKKFETLSKRNVRELIDKLEELHAE